MSYRDVGERISAKYKQRLGAASQNRLDLCLADHEMIGKDQAMARCLIAYNALHGEPTKEDIQRFVWSSFDQKVLPILDTAKIYSDKQAVEIIVEPVRATLAFENSKKMAPVITGKTYVDKDSSLWEVRSSEDGTKYLVRKSEENIEEILADRRKYVNAGATLPSFRTIKKSAGYVNAQEGDVVEFYQGTTPMQGKVVSIGKDNTVKVSTGKATLTIPRPAILRVVQHSAGYTKQKMNYLKEYFEKFLGPELAQKLTAPGDNAAKGTGATNR